MVRLELEIRGRPRRVVEVTITSSDCGKCSVLGEDVAASHTADMSDAWPSRADDQGLAPAGDHGRVRGERATAGRWGMIRKKA
jgi:hypothetical protein